MSEETKKPSAPETEAQPAPETKAPEAESQPSQPEPAEAGKSDGKAEKEKKDWFGKKSRELESVKAKLDDAEKKNAQLKDQLLRTAAEYDNYRKRSAREADQKFNDGVSHAVNQILGILDTLEMAANAECSDENYKKGVVMTLDKAGKALHTLNIKEIDAQGKPFDPNFMNAVQQVPPAEGQESGTVVQVFQKGYMIGDRIIRHATVVVAE
ncbi:MAG: nucleotide exchange factor GrpE [Gemmiger sp.]|uniref:nucleotide exchange factor GrpE n=1 Tax=Gemmiger sp. TaxID=2049027 RepID=UPI002E795B2D|nr:nucleotide exchange factor GrpE [Gemmiger sp.]MEE0800893.1 nucleotide exchange factor GrpE [Gemmiger sp.]